MELARMRKGTPLAAVDEPAQARKALSVIGQEVSDRPGTGIAWNEDAFRRYASAGQADPRGGALRGLGWPPHARWDGWKKIG